MYDLLLAWCSKGLEGDHAQGYVLALAVSSQTTLKVTEQMQT
jgi:hypothetical protein